MATAQVLLERGRGIDEVAKRTEEIFEKEFSEINGFCEELSAGKYSVC
jgi:S-adenosylmethionine synthetase